VITITAPVGLSLYSGKHGARLESLQPLAATCGLLGRDSGENMPYVITDTCAKDQLCVDSCPSDAIHPKADEAEWEAETQMYINPEECMDCGACVATCPTNSIYSEDEVPEDKKEYIAKNANFFKK
jgi:ferredoxin